MSDAPFPPRPEGRSVPDATAALDRLNATLVELINVLDKLVARTDLRESQRVPVRRAVPEGIDAVRRSGRTNMLDRPVVAAIADELGYPDAARWVRENRALYTQAMFHGFVTDNPGGDEPPQPKDPP